MQQKKNTLTPWFCQPGAPSFRVLGGRMGDHKPHWRLFQLMLDPGSSLRKSAYNVIRQKISSFIFNKIQNRFRAKMRIMYPFFLDSGGHASTPLSTGGKSFTYDS
jgi:hypothetical protein